MKTIAHSNIAKRLSTMFAVAFAGAVIAGSFTPAMAGKHGGGGGKHHGGGGWGKHGGGHHGHPSKPPQNPGPFPPMPRPQSQPLPKPVPQPPVVVVRDHRVPKPVATGGGVKVSDTPVIRDHRRPVTTSTARPRTTTVKVAGVKILTVKSKGKACVGSYCL